MPSTTVAVGQFWTNLESSRVYRIAEVSEDRNPRTTYLRGDGAHFEQFVNVFVMRFRLSTPTEVGSFWNTLHETLTATQQIATIDATTQPQVEAMPTPDPQPVVIPEVGQYYTHTESGKVYCITDVTDGNITYQRGDGRDFTLSVTVFNARLRRATPEESATFAHRVTEGSDDGDDGGEVGTLIPPNPTIYNWDRVILNQSVVREIRSTVRSILNREDIVSRFRLADLDENTNRSVMNCHGDPGTGKTLAAKCISAELGKPLYQVDYASVISKYFGDTAKHIKSAFRKATQHNAILFFDEGDSLLSRRQAGGDGANSLNQNRNVLMQELDRFNGIVIISTNLFSQYDPAIVRRINRHIRFPLPTVEERKRLYEIHIRVPEYTEGINYDQLAEVSGSLSGGDIKVAVLNAIERACCSENRDEWILTQQDLIECTEAVKTAKAANASGQLLGA